MTDRQVTVSDDSEGKRIERAKREAFGTTGQEIIDQAQALHNMYLSWLVADQMVETNEGLDEDARRKWRNEREHCAKAVVALVAGTLQLAKKTPGDAEFRRGQRDAMRRFAWWKDGEQYVGSGRYTLREALDRFVGEEFCG